MKVIIEKKSFKVSKKSGIVVCDIKARIDFTEISSLKGASLYGDFTVTDNKGNISYPFNLSARGIARCSKDDSFDESLGKKIAANRARLELYGMVKQALSKFKKSVDILKRTLDNSEKTLECFKTREKQRLNSLFQPMMEAESKEETIVE